MIRPIKKGPTVGKGKVTDAKESEGLLSKQGAKGGEKNIAADLQGTRIVPQEYQPDLPICAKRGQPESKFAFAREGEEGRGMEGEKLPVAAPPTKGELKGN